MNKSFTSLSALEAEIIKQVNKVLETKVASVVKDEITSSISEKIYQPFSPSWYDRRADNGVGGMGNPIGTGSVADPNEMKHATFLSGSEISLEVWDEADSSRPWSKDLTTALIEGYGSKDQWYNIPRDFLEATREELSRNKNHVDAMKDGLEKVFGVGNVIRS